MERKSLSMSRTREEVLDPDDDASLLRSSFERIILVPPVDRMIQQRLLQLKTRHLKTDPIEDRLESETWPLEA